MTIIIMMIVHIWIWAIVYIWCDGRRRRSGVLERWRKNWIWPVLLRSILSVIRFFYSFSSHRRTVANLHEIYNAVYPYGNILVIVFNFFFEKKFCSVEHRIYESLNHSGLIFLVSILSLLHNKSIIEKSHTPHIRVYNRNRIR